jgi:hypothetical protein
MSGTEELGMVKEWLRIDGNEEDLTITSLLLASSFVIKQSTGVIEEDVSGDQEALELYRLIQRLIITDLYENRTGASKPSPLIISLCMQLKAFKLQGGVAT